MPPAYHADAFGLRWRSDIPLDGFDRAAADPHPTQPIIDVVRVDALSERIGGRAVNRGFVYADGFRFVSGTDPHGIAVAFDMTGGDRIAYAPGPDWPGTMPASFYGTVAALTAAWRGAVPLHASAVEFDGRALLIAGRAGAGKSSLAAGLVAAGGRFVADDLVVVTRVDAGARIGVTRGRPTMRLHPGTAALVDTIAARAVDGDERGKWLASPRRRSLLDRTSPAVLLLLGDAGPPRRVRRIDLFAHVFRPRWIDALPMRDAIMADVLALAATIPMLPYPAQEAFTVSEWRRRAEDALAILKAGVER